MTLQGAFYAGTVVHKRLRPKPHALSYSVFNVLLDLDQIDKLAGRCRLFSHNKLNILSFHDRDHAAGERGPLAAHARKVFAASGFDLASGRILLLAYPRVLGYVFNPLSVYFGISRLGHLEALIYEVSNTFGERKSYVVAAGTEHGGVFEQSCIKEMFVSPFAPQHGRYGFRVTPPGESVLVGVSLRDSKGPLIKTHFRGEVRPFNDRTILGLLARQPLLTLKIIGAIHWEAIKLWSKGVPLIRGHRSPRYSISTTTTTPATGTIE